MRRGRDVRTDFEAAWTVKGTVFVTRSRFCAADTGKPRRGRVIQPVRQQRDNRPPRDGEPRYGNCPASPIPSTGEAECSIDRSCISVRRSRGSSKSSPSSRAPSAINHGRFNHLAAPALPNCGLANREWVNCRNSPTLQLTHSPIRREPYWTTLAIIPGWNAQ